MVKYEEGDIRTGSSSRYEEVDVRTSRDSTISCENTNTTCNTEKEQSEKETDSKKSDRKQEEWKQMRVESKALRTPLTT